jgi:hypothetical protein
MHGHGGFFLFLAAFYFEFKFTFFEGGHRIFLARATQAQRPALGWILKIISE